MNKIRERINSIIEHDGEGRNFGIAYDIIMLIAITASIIPLLFAKEYPAFQYIEIITVALFIIDYFLRWITADLRMKKGGVSFAIYPFTPWAIIDLLSILPGLSILAKGFKIFRVTRLLKVLRLFKYFRYSQNIQVIGRVVKKEKNVLLIVLGIAIFYVFLTALVMFNAEPRINPLTGETTFKTFFDALYWATVTLTTVGYGDITPVSYLGRLVSMLSSIFGVAIIALPSGVITASYLDELRNLRDKSSNASNS